LGVGYSLLATWHLAIGNARRWPFYRGFTHKARFSGMFKVVMKNNGDFFRAKFRELA
jgi:hypothetical protein